jgi:hypothetical protein
MYCTKCGVRVADNDRFCSECGWEVSAALPIADKSAVPAASEAPEVAAASETSEIAGENETHEVAGENKATDVEIISEASEFAAVNAAPEIAIISQPAPVIKKSAEKKEKIFFGKGAFLFCLAVIAILSILTGVFAGLYIRGQNGMKKERTEIYGQHWE